MRFGDLPRFAQLYVAGVCGLALAVASLAALQPSMGASLDLFGLLIVATAVSHSYPVSTPGKQAYHVSLPFFVAAIILLSPLQLLALVGAVQVVESLRRNRATSAQVFFNGAVYALTALVAQAIYRTLWPGQGAPTADLSQPACLGAGLAAAATFAILKRVLVSLALWFARHISPRDQHAFELEGLLTDGVLFLMGVPLAHLVQVAPWAAAVGSAPLWLIHRVLELPNMRAQSRQDGLTELFTAPYLTEACTRELNRGRRFNRPVCLLLLDVDALGELNAVYGHQTGDAVLRATARTIGGELREYDLPARLAGGLFAVLLPETDLAQAQAVAERVRRGTAELRHEVPGSVDQVRVTLSIGGALVNGQSATAGQLFEAAEAALARAKQDGGNQIGFQAVHASMLAAVPADGRTAGATLTPGAHQAVPATRANRGFVAKVLRQHGQSIALCALAAIGLAVCLIGAIAALDWAMLAVMLSVSTLAGFAFYFKSLPLALALASELNRSPARLHVVRVWRMWPQYAAVGIAGLLVAYAYDRLGLSGAIAMGVVAFVVRHLAGRYVDRTLDSVRKLRNANEALEHQAFHDALTNLPNRALFAERLEHAMLRAGDGSVAVLFLDLDNFKTVNDTLGHAAGDALLTAATARLLQCVRREDTIARLGGDEFTVLLEDMRDPSDAARMAERIAELLRTPFELAGQQFVVSASIGIALDIDRSHRPDDLLREADMAMYRAKSNGKSRYEIFDTDMAERAMERLDLETDLRQAVERGELELYYRPVVSLASGAPEAMEVQLRWQHPRRGLLEAADFMRVAEESGLILDLGRWALERACRDARQWQSVRPGAVVQLDLSPRLLEQSDIAALVHDTLVDAGLPPACLRLEVAESAVSQDDLATGRVLASLRKLGVRLALDDVGAGASSLGALSRLPVDVLKIDARLVDQPELLRAGVALGTALGMTVTVQGVEHAEQAAILAALGCSHAQGELYGPPQTAQHAQALFSTGFEARRAA